MMIRTPLLQCVGAVAAVSVTALAHAESAALTHAPVAMGSQPVSEAPSAPAVATDATDAPSLKSAGTAGFGDSGSTWWSVGGGAAFGFGDVDGKGYVAITHFVAQDLELTGEIGGWYLSTHADNSSSSDDDESTGGGSLSGIIRYHFVNTGAWTVYIDGGIGVIFSGEDVPEGGSSVNFLPRVGAGFTARLTDATRLQVGAHWHHVSNGDFNGDDDNPGRDGVLVYAGLIFAF
jgi:hypothetical protein